MRWLTSLVVLGTTTCLAAQEDPERTARQLLADAELAVEESGPEAAALLLRAAIRESNRIVDDSARRNLQTRLESKMHDIDPIWGDEARARIRGSRALALEAKNEIKRGWRRVASVLLDAADRLAPGSAREVRRELGDVDEATTATLSLHATHFGTHTNPMGESGWQVGADEIVSPPLQGKTIMLVGNTELRGKFTLDSEIRLGVEPTKVAILFGYTPEGHYHLFELHSDLNVAELRLFRWDGRQMVELGRQLATLTRAERAAWLPVSVQVDQTAIEGRIGDIEQVRGTTSTEVAGQFGFFASKDSRNQDPIHVRLTSVMP
ncbi:MAG: hypothetical protein KDB80_12345 [Planctomycetes bacterium]|nr:hypothetical protein [Planctomycetota bacterium]